MRQFDDFKLYFFMEISLNIWHFHLGSKYWLWLRIKDRRMGGLGSWREGRIRRMFQINSKDILPRMIPNTVLPMQESTSSSCNGRQGCKTGCRSRGSDLSFNVLAIHPVLPASPGKVVLVRSSKKWSQVSKSGSQIWSQLLDLGQRLGQICTMAFDPNIPGSEGLC